MHIGKVTLACLGWIALVFAEEEIISSTATASDATIHQPPPSTVSETTTATENVCQHDPSLCNCTSSQEFENIQKNLDTCLFETEEKTKSANVAMETCQGNNVALMKSLDAKVEIESQWEKEKDEMESMIAELKQAIDVLTNNEVLWKQQHEDLHAQVTSVQGELKLKQDQNDNLHAQIISFQNELNTINGAKEDEAVASAAIQQHLTDTTEKLSQCHQTITEHDTKYENVLQRLNDVQSKQEQIKTKQNQKVQELRNQISKINKELENQKRVTRSTQDRFHDTSERLTKVDRELRMMHIKAQQTYFNSTLLKEDTMSFISKTMDRAIIFGEDLMFHDTTKHAYSKGREYTQNALKPIIPIFEKYVRPQFLNIEKEIKKYDAVEGTRLLMISIVENISTVGFNYIELTKSNKGGTKRLQMKVMRFLKGTKDNAAYFVDVTIRVVMLYLGYKILSFFVRSFLSIIVSRKTK